MSICKYYWNGICEMTAKVKSHCIDRYDCHLFMPRSNHFFDGSSRFLITWIECFNEEDVNDHNPCGELRTYLVKDLDKVKEFIKDLKKEPGTKVDRIYQVTGVIPLEQIDE